MPLPTLRRKNIVREIVRDDEDEDDGVETLEEDDVDIDVENAEVRTRGKAKGKVKGEDQKRDNMNTFDIAIAYQKPFHSFPGLKHHVHPFFVIYNALPQLRQHIEDLPRQHLRRADDDDDDKDDNMSPDQWPSPSI